MMRIMGGFLPTPEKVLRMKKALASSAPVLLLFLVCLATASIAGDKKVQKPKTEDTLYGTVSCSVPAPPPDPAKAGAQTPDSVQLCLARRGKVVIVDDVTKNGIPIENPDTVKGYEGHRISSSGYMHGDSFHVISVRTL